MSSRASKQSIWFRGAKFSLHVMFNIFLYGLLVWGMIFFTKEAYEFSYQIFGNVAVAEEPGTDVMITIRRGDTTKEIAELLEYKRVIANRNSFFIRAKLMVNDTDPILPGVYKLNTSMNYGEIIETITNPSENMDENSELE